ncbi:membrane-associated protein, putative [Bodo saltans]|uniref:Membrane-associated protein, putative n=1 Tax=Bodo saltans TaxID=75058 RepID=A0A0S4J754_BODSA|nr:membrane-associated protein, putative [Bodo saltans]|eukprot:CUG85758.1 membrane-associated protein, putative [Bodo saltans]
MAVGKWNCITSTFLFSMVALLFQTLTVVAQRNLEPTTPSGLTCLSIGTGDGDGRDGDTSSNIIIVRSHSSYTFTNCKHVIVLSPDATSGECSTTNNVVVLQNVSITVVGSNTSALPSVQLYSSYCSVKWEGVRVVIRNVSTTASDGPSAARLLCPSLDVASAAGYLVTLSQFQVSVFGSLLHLQKEVSVTQTTQLPWLLRVESSTLIDNFTVEVARTSMNLTNTPIVGIVTSRDHTSVNLMTFRFRDVKISMELTSDGLQSSDDYGRYSFILFRNVPSVSRISVQLENVLANFIINTTGLVNAGVSFSTSDLRLMWSIAHINIPSINQSNNIEFGITNSNVRVHHAQASRGLGPTAVLESSLVSLEASVFFLDFSGDSDTRNVSVWISNCSMHMSANSRIQLFGVSGGDYGSFVSATYGMMVTVQRVTLSAETTGFLPLSSSQRQACIVWIDSVNPVDDFSLLITDVKMTVSMEVGDRERLHVPGVLRVQAWLLWAQLVFLHRSIVNNGNLRVLNSHVMISDPTNGYITADFGTVVICSLELMTMAFTTFDRCAIDFAGHDQQCFALSDIRSSTHVILGGPMSQVTAVSIGNLLHTNVSLRNVTVRVPQFHSTPVASLALFPSLSACAVMICTLPALLAKTFSFTALPWQRANVTITSGTSLEVDAELAAGPVSCMIILPIEIGGNTSVTIHLDTYEEALLRTAAATSVSRYRAVIPVVANRTTFAGSSRLMLSGNVRGTPTSLLYCQRSGAINLKEGSSIAFQNVVAVMNGGSAAPSVIVNCSVGIDTNPNSRIVFFSSNFSQSSSAVITNKVLLLPSRSPLTRPIFLLATCGDNGSSFDEVAFVGNMWMGERMECSASLGASFFTSSDDASNSCSTLPCPKYQRDETKSITFVAGSVDFHPPSSVEQSAGASSDRSMVATEKSATHGRARPRVVVRVRSRDSKFAVAMNFVGGLPLPATECGIVFGVACLIPFAGIVAMVWRRPCRVHLTMWLNVLQYVLTFSTLLVTVRGADGTILSLLALGLSFVTILKLIGTVAALMWETKVTALLLLLNQRVEGGQKLQQHRLVTGSTEIQLRDTSSGAGERHSSQSKSQSSSSNSHNEEAMQKPIYEDLLSYDQREALMMVLRMCCNNTHHHQNDPALELRKGEHRPTEESWSPVNLGDLRRGRRNELVSVEPVLHSVYGAQRRAQRQQQHAVSYRVVNQLL